ncbi:cytochrome c biogenesis protein CcdA [Martelella alba]|uniref:Cytochrome c biogenesis protein CcdA n=1 Tax=Martelella alba TaxID=2590451 RepID=A0A506UIP9_9HYPH|nr:cytochrome c biogenesis protein CcdA [Martelella alba]TPW33211.1 cytochrome c biogenesis protein CcdA [Martelella alba]
MSMIEISLLSALVAGALSFLSPCVLPLVPPYLCFMAGISVEQLKGANDETRANRMAVLLPAFFFTLGFATVFVALGVGASSIGQLLRQSMDVLSKVGGVIIIVMGLHFLGVVKIPILAREARFHGAGRPASLTGAYVMGLAFAFGWTPCIGPVLGAILAVAASKNTLWDGALLLSIYSLGLAVPFWIAAFFSGAFMRFLVRFRRHIGAVEKVMGAFLILTGLAFLFGFVADIAIWFQSTFPILSTIG